MKRQSNFPIAALLIGVVLVASLLGHRIDKTREAELFFRWIQGQATQHRIFSESRPETDDNKDMKDTELFGKILEATEKLIPNATVNDEKGVPQKKLLSLSKDESGDKAIWNLASGKDLAPLRMEFLTYLRQKKLSNVSSEFDPGDVYSQDRGGANVNLANVFLGFRKIAANFVWMQVDRYWHEGQLHRMVPLMKTCVTLDPNFVDAYLLGAWHLAYNMSAKLPETPEPLKEYNVRYRARVGEKELLYYRATDFLKDGILKNPRNYKLYFDLGFAVYKIKLLDYPNAVLYLSEALRYRHDKWVPRQLYICYELNKQYDEALAGWQDYAAKNPENTEVAPRFVKRNTGMIRERDAAAAEALAKSAATPEEAAKKQAEADALWAEATKIWEEMNTAGGEQGEPFAMGRLMRMKALKYMKEGRYIEAIAVLENARWKSNEFWFEASDLIIDAKNKAGIPLSVSEKKAVLRNEEAERFLKEHPLPEAK